VTLNEADTRTQLIDPVLHARGWTEDLIRREETLGTVEIVDGRPCRQTHGRTDYTLRIKVTPDAQPVAVAVLETGDQRRLAVPLLLGICYGASIGGVGTPIGSPPNIIFMRVYEQNTGIEVSFLEWMRWGVPTVVLFLPIMAWWLTRGLEGGEAVVIPPPGTWSTEEKRVLAVFGVTALAWITRQDPFGGWSHWLGLPGASDASVALAAAVLMFVIADGRGGRLLDWETASRIPWGVLLLFAGGIAIATAFDSSGLAQRLAENLIVLSGLPAVLMILMICLGVTFLTEITSNTATTSLLMPILAAAASATAVEPALLMVPAAISASFAFMLPVATPPNAIVFSTGRVHIRSMVRHGFALNLMGAVVITTICLVVPGM